MPKPRDRRPAPDPAPQASEWTPRRLAKIRREVIRRLAIFTQSLEYKRGLEAEQQKAPSLSTGGSAVSGAYDND